MQPENCVENLRRKASSFADTVCECGETRSSKSIQRLSLRVLKLESKFSDIFPADQPMLHLSVSVDCIMILAFRMLSHGSAALSVEATVVC